MDPADSVVYSKVNQALLQSLNFTEEYFREKFRGSAPKDEETVYYYLARLNSYWERWVELSGTT